MQAYGALTAGKYPYLRAVEVKRGGKSLGKEDNDGFESYIKREDVIAYDTSLPHVPLADRSSGRCGFRPD